MLYCCILPKILIYHKDCGKVEEAIKNQMSYITKLEHGIERDSQVLDDLYKVLCKQQDERLNQFEHIASMKRCSKAFVQTIDADLKKRQNRLCEKVHWIRVNHHEIINSKQVRAQQIGFFKIF